MRLLLLNLPWNENGRWGVRAGSRWPFTSQAERSGYVNYIPFPFFLAYATSLLKKNGHKGTLIDAIAERFDEKEVLDRIQALAPELIVVETSTPSLENDLKILYNIRANISGCKIALSGPHASVFAGGILATYQFIDYILIGEYEYTLLELINCLERHRNLNSVAGLAYRENNSVKINCSRATIGNLDTLPWPEREDVPIYKYNDGFAGLPSPNVQIWASRGCPFQCSFCLWPQTIYREHRYRKRRPINVVDEIEYLIKKFNFKAVFFDDDVFNVDRNYVLGICEEIMNRKIKIPWAIMARADIMDEGLLEFMSKAGLYAIKYGIESVDKNVLDSCRKFLDLRKAYRIIKATRAMGIKIHLTFCLGLAGETKESIKKTKEFIQDVKPDSLQFSFAVPFPGTEYFEYVKTKNFLLSEDWSDYDGNYKCIIKTKELSNADLEAIRNDFRRSFNP